VSVLLRGSNGLVLDEVERSLHDALCVIRSLVKSRALIAGGGAPEIEIARQLEEHARTVKGGESAVLHAYAEALEIIPYTLAENAGKYKPNPGMNPIVVVTELRNKHSKGDKYAGISVKKGMVNTNIREENVLQPALVTQSALTLATEVVRMILKIDDVVMTAR
jgi:T-complex protein 1 subunit delta